MYLFCADESQALKCMLRATKRDQAKIVFDDAVKMVRASKALAGRIIYKIICIIPRIYPIINFVIQ
ncbi:hypothetical protein [Piscirickettsia salmonis]|uniref:hypothetical protein n=1 Tax=Piscirickettsia salmonis TaxID=1238 RepID=UPI003BF55057